MPASPVSPASSPPRSPRAALRLGRVVCAVLLAVTAVNHARLAAAGAGSVARHELFVVLNLALALLLVRKPRWALVATLALALQQLTSHGADLLESLRGPGPVDWASAGVLVFFPALITLLIAERRIAGTREHPRAGRPGS
jgi:hypothetical protein